jgi:hypothetical protein
VGTAIAAPTALTGLAVRPRSDWAAGIPAPGPLPQERRGDVRLLLVHHSASPNDYSPDAVGGVIRGFHSFHTGPEKGWPDVAYNFFVDRYGTVWEGRAGSLAGPVMPDATGGSQGFSQIACFIGDHTSEPPTPEAQQAMTSLLAGLAETYGIDPTPGATTTFESRGSNKWPAGTPVTTTTIAGHRDMSLTSCPGDAAYPLVRDVFPGQVAALLAARATPTPTSAPAPTATAEPTEPQSSAAAPVTSQAPASTASTDREDGGWDATTVGLLAGTGLLAGGATYGLLRRSKQEGHGGPRPTP